MQEIPFPTGRTKKIPVPRPGQTQTPVAKIEPIQLPTESNTKVDTPVKPELTRSRPAQFELDKTAPLQPELTREAPTEIELTKEQPEVSEMNREMPSKVNTENCVEIDGELYEIKPTKLKYFRNKMAGAYSVIKAVPLNELLTYDKGILDPEKDADQILFDFLVAAFDDADFVTEHYEDMTADDIEKVVAIFGRLNHIDEKAEQARKNKEAQASNR